MQPIAAAMLRQRSPEHASPRPRSADAPARTLVDILHATTAANGEQSALDADVALSYAELADRARALADRLAEWGVGPGDRVGVAGENWPKNPPPPIRARRFWKLMYLGGIALENLLSLIAAGPLVALLVLSGGLRSDHGTAVRLIVEAPLFGGGFLLTYGLLVALAVRATGRIVRPGFHPDWGAAGWALWFGESLMDGARGVLFSLYSSLYIRPWLRLAGIEIGRRSEISTAAGMNRLTRFAEHSFAADDVVLAGARGRGGWLHVAPIEIGRRTFLGNGAILQPDTRLGDDCLIGVLTTAPRRTPDGTSWFGVPALELPRVPDHVDPSRTVSPAARLVIARLAMELIRILLPASLSVALGSLVFSGRSRNSARRRE